MCLVFTPLLVNLEHTDLPNDAFFSRSSFGQPFDAGLHDTRFDVVLIQAWRVLLLKVVRKSSDSQ